MNTISKYYKFIPYLYFITITAYWFTDVNKSEGLTAYPILLFGIPFLWQILKPNRKLNAVLGIVTVCLSSYLILAYLSDILRIVQLSEGVKRYIIFGGLFVITNFCMSVWMIRNSIKRSF